MKIFTMLAKKSNLSNAWFGSGVLLDVAATLNEADRRAGSR